MNILRIENDYSYFLSEEHQIKHEIWERLRFRDRNYFHNRAYKMKKWDGFIQFFSIETGKFLTGLLPEIKAVLNHFNVKYNIEDKRQKTQFLYKEIDQNFLNQWLPEKTLNGDLMKPITLYDYQIDLINQIIKYHRGIIFAPTGSGKSYTMLSILKTLPPNTPTLVLQNRITLAQQNYDEFKNWGIQNLGSLWGGNVNPNLVTVATVQSISKIESLLPKIKVLIVDEIHEMLSSKSKAVYRKLRNADVRVAVSATPFKFGGKDSVQKYYVKGFFGPILKIKSTESGILTTNELQGRDILSPSRCIFYPITEPQIPYDIYIDAITRGIAESYYFHKVVTRLAKRQKGRTLILVERIAHGDTLHNLIPKSLWIQGKDDQETRKHVIKQLQKSKSCIAIATQQIFSAGVNFFINNLINAASGKAEHQIIQRMGRGLRTADDKDILNYYDFIFKINDYLEDHSYDRVKILKKEGHEVIIKDEIDF